MRKIDQTIYTCHSGKLPEEALGKKIAVLADLHNNRFGTNDEELIRLIRDFAPDLIAIPGDFLVGKRQKQDYEPTLYLLRQLRGIAPVYYSPGNHEEMLLESEEFSRGFREFLGLCWEQDIEVLWNENRMTPFGIRIYGLAIGMKHYGRFRKGKISAEDMNGLLGPKQEEYTLLLAHHPEFFPSYAAWGADLVISGHQHGGMFRLPFVGGVVSPQFSLFPKYDAGLYQEEDSRMVLSRGLGSHTVDLRFLGNAPEFVGIVLDN